MCPKHADDSDADHTGAPDHTRSTCAHASTATSQHCANYWQDYGQPE